MNRKSTSEPASAPADPATPAWPSAEGLCSAATDALKASQRILEFVEQAQALQFAVLRSWGVSMQSALEAAARAENPGDILAAQNGMFNAIAAEAVNCQAEVMKGLQALQEELAPNWPKPFAAIPPLPAPATVGAAPAFALPDLTAAFEEARRGFDTAAREWAGVWAKLQTPVRPAA